MGVEAGGRETSLILYPQQQLHRDRLAKKNRTGSESLTGEGGFLSGSSGTVKEDR